MVEQTRKGSAAVAVSYHCVHFNVLTPSLCAAATFFSQNQSGPLGKASLPSPVWLRHWADQVDLTLNAPLPRRRPPGMT